MTTDELVQNQGAWHKTCYVKFSKEKLQRAVKKRSRCDDSAESTSEKKRPRRQSVDKMVCLFCHQGDKHMHNVTTFEVDQSLRQMATALHETELIARMEVIS